MARPEDVCLGTGKYKIWKPWSIGDYYHTIEPSQITPLPKSKIVLVDIMTVRIVDDIGIGYNKTMKYYLYDFIKEGETITDTQYVLDKRRGKEKKTVYYDDSLEEKLGGTKEKIGGI